LRKLWEIVKDREAWCAAGHGGHKDLDTSKRLNNSNTVSFTPNPRYCLRIPLFRTLRS